MFTLLHHICHYFSAYIKWNFFILCFCFYFDFYLFNWDKVSLCSPNSAGRNHHPFTSAFITWRYKAFSTLDHTSASTIVKLGFCISHSNVYSLTGLFFTNGSSPQLYCGKQQSSTNLPSRKWPVPWSCSSFCDPR